MLSYITQDSAFLTTHVLTVKKDGLLERSGELSYNMGRLVLQVWGELSWSDFLLGRVVFGRVVHNSL